MPKIVNYREGPPVLDQCDDCSHALVGQFSPQGCPNKLEVQSRITRCFLGLDPWEDRICKNFIAGVPGPLIMMPIVAR